MPNFDRPDSNSRVIISATSKNKERHPSWFPEVALFLEAWMQSGLVSKLQEGVRVGRGRMGDYDTCDYVLLLLSYAVSHEATLETFYENLDPVKEILAALWQRQTLPSRSALSRFLKNGWGPGERKAMASFGILWNGLAKPWWRIL